MKLGLLFAGQGSQHAGMGKDLYEAFPAFRQAIDQADEVVDFDLKEMSFEDANHQLEKTEYTQPCMIAFATGVLALLEQEGISFEAAAGLSLGEYAALCAAKAITPKQAVELVAFRGKAMTQASQGIDCKMAAILGLTRQALQEVCKKASEYGVVEIANYNCPGQIVIAGEAQAVEFACEKAKEVGAKRCLPLNVSGPFHTSFMKPAGEALQKKLSEITFQPFQSRVYFNCLGAPMNQGDNLVSLLVRQVQSSVYLEDILLRMREDGIDTFLEIGPGKVLTGFVKKTLKGSTVYSIETKEEFEEVINILKGESV